MGLEFRILGPLEVRLDGNPVQIGGPRQRALLAMLLLSANRVVSRDRLIDELLPDAPAGTADHQLRVQVSRLRKALSPAGRGPARMETRAPGYLLKVEPGELDLDRFEQLLAEGDRALAERDYERAAQTLREAESLWRGRPLADLEFEPFARVDVERLLQLRLAAMEDRIEAELSLGRHAMLVPELEGEVAEHPLRERLRAQLMLALYRCGRQADALETYRAGRALLSEELALEPSPALRQLEQSILRQEAGLEFSGREPGQLATEIAAPPAPAAQEAALDGVDAALGRPRRIRGFALGALALGMGAITALVVMILASGGGSAAPARTLRAPAVGLMDATSGQPRAAAPLGFVATRIIATGTADWATSYANGTLLRIDPHRLLVTQTINVGPGATGVTVAAGDAWVASSLDATVGRVDLSTSAIVQRIRVGTDPTDLAAARGILWVSNNGDGTVSRVDAHTGAVLGTTAVGPNPRGIAVGAGAVWVAVSGANVVARLDPRTGRVLDRIQTGQGPTQLAVGRAGLWVANDLDSTVSLIDPSTDTVTMTRAVRGIPAALAPAGDGVWVALSDRPMITFVQASGATREIRIPSPASALAPSPAGVLIAVRGAGADHRGGTVVVRTTFPIGQINPGQCCDMPPDVRDLSYDGLLGFSKLPGSAGTLVPDLALAIPRAQAGGRLYTFRLRPGLRYWNGAPVRASDFVRGFERAAAGSDIWAGYIAVLPGALACPRHPRTCDLSKAMIANDRAGTLTLRLSHPDPELLPALGLAGFAPAPPGGGITPGTGPYLVARFVSGRLIVLERNRYFREWAPAAQPAGYPNSILIQSGAPASADVAAVLNGKADYTFDQPTPSQLAQIELHEPGQLHISPLPSVDSLFLDTRAPPFNDIRVRRALNFAVDRAAIVNLFGGPAAATPDCQIIPATVPGHSPYCPYTRDPSPAGRWTGPDLRAARSLIAASGTRGDRVTLLTQPGVPADEATGRYMVGLLDRLGFRARLRLLSPTQHDAVLNDYRNPPQIGTDSWIADFPSPSQWISKFLSCAAWNPPLNLTNHAQFCDHQVDSIAQRAAQLESTDPVAANKLWAQADRRITGLAPWVPTVSENEIDLVSRRVGNYQYVPTIGALIDQLWVR